MLKFEALSETKIRAIVQIENALLLSSIEIFECIDSTSTYLLQKIKSYPQSGQFCFAEEQTQGRGRLGRSWFSPKGANIYCSLLWNFDQQDVSALSLVIGVIIIKALKKYGIHHDIKLKWPNDIVFNNRKLGGILLEKSGNFVVIGFGLNVYLPEKVEKELAINAVDLSSLSSEKIKRNELAGLLVNELLMQLPLFSQKGLGAFLQDWRSYNALQDRPIMVNTPQGVIEGVMQDINEQGELIVKDKQGVCHSFCYGEVSVRPGTVN